MVPELMNCLGHYMSLIVTRLQLMRMHSALALLVSVLLVSACSSSDAPQSREQVDAAAVVPTTVAVDDETADDTTQPDQITPLVPVVNQPDLEPETDSEPVQDVNPVVPDPLEQHSTVVDFEITVPAYVSDALQVRVVWGDRDFAAQWVGDEIWSATSDFPTSTEQQLTVTFYDDNGDVTLGSFEQHFITGSNDLEIFTITADQFNTDKWDSDNDGISNIDESASGAESSTPTRVLLFSETREFRHSSIESALKALEELAVSVGIQTTRADDSSGVFTEMNLANYDAVIWVLTSGDVLNADEQVAFEGYIRSNGGYAGIHAASDTEYDWPWYGALVGAYFERHPDVQSATQNVEDGSHSSTSHLGSSWTRTDEWYDYNSNPRTQVNVLLSLDEDSYSDGGMGSDHPSAWYHEYDGGRSWYTGGGHTETSYSESDFRAHLLGGLLYAAGRDGDNTTVR